MTVSLLTVAFVLFIVFLGNITDEKLFILISTHLYVLYEIYEIRKESLTSIRKEEYKVMLVIVKSISIMFHLF